MARPKLGAGDTHRLQIKISDEELQAIDDWRYANRVPSRSEAVRRLVQIGLRAEREMPKLLEHDAVGSHAIQDISDTLNNAGTQLRQAKSEDERIAIVGELIASISLKVEALYSLMVDRFMHLGDLATEIAPLVKNKRFDEALRRAEDAKDMEADAKIHEIQSVFDMWMKKK